MIVDSPDDPQAKFRFQITGPSLAGNRGGGCVVLIHLVGQAAERIVMVGGLLKKTILINAIQGYCLAAFTSHNDLRDFVAIADNVHLGAVGRVAGIIGFVSRNLDVF